MHPTAIITGSAHRLGKAIAKKLFDRGCNIVLHYGQSAQAAEQLANDFNQIRENGCVTVSCDLAKKDDYFKIIDSALTNYSRIDYLINNASAFYPQALDEFKDKDFLRLLTTNWITPAKLAEAAFPHLSKNSGAIVNILDIYAQAGHSNHTIYVASKSGLAETTMQQAKAFAPNVRVNGVSPGAILWPDSEFQSQSHSQSVLTERQAILENSALKKLGSPEDIANCAAFLALDATYITGENINVDGGRRLYI